MPSYATIIPTLALAASAAAYTWPNKQYEELEHVLIDNGGYNDAGFAAAVTPCSRYVQSAVNTTGRQSSAQWQRVMFHDLSTADISKGTGGIDASIAFETGRAENKGAAMNDTLGWYAKFFNKHVGMADMVALGTIVSSASCSGPIINFKAGRIDATGGGDSGVPEPEQSAEEIFTQLAKVGFNKTETIQFTACGHTIGSVHHSGFPEILGPELVSPTNTNGGQTFDDTVDVYDVHVVQQYNNGTTKNALVTSFNETNRSDKRIYESDGNKTMIDLGRSNDYFLGVCHRIYEKAINTVPRGVSLFDVTPITVKPVNVVIDVSTTGTVTFKGAIRLLGTSFAPSTSRKVVIAWKGTDNKEFTVTAAPAQTGASTFLKTNNFFYPFSSTVSAAGVSSFVVRVTENGRTTTYDNNGARYSIVDGAQFLPKLSAFTVDGSTSTFKGVISAAIHKSVNPRTVSATFSVPVPVVGAMNPTIQTFTVPLTKAGSLGSSNYFLYQASGGPFPIPDGGNSTSRSVSLAGQATLDIVATQPGQPTLIDEFRKVSEVGINIL